MSEPTPGEWRADRYTNYPLVANSWYVTADPEGTVNPYPLAKRIDSEADARLMASAKTMATIIERLKVACRRDSAIDLADTMKCILGGEPETVPDTCRLAYAVLDGDDQAALILADEVHEQFTRGKGFVPREELEQQLAEAKTPAGVRDAFMALDPSVAWEMALELPIPTNVGVTVGMALSRLLPAAEAIP